MNTQQRDHLLSLIDNDTHLRQRYVAVKQGVPQYCVIGCMLADTGLDVAAEFINQKTDDHKRKNIARIGGLEYITRLTKHFGLTKDQIRDLQEINDGWIQRKDRQRELKAYVNGVLAL